MKLRKRKRLVMAAIAAQLGLSGCAINPALSEEQLRADNLNTAQPHPRALLLARVQPACVMFCTATLSLSNSEGVKAATQGGDLTTSEAQSQSNQTTVSPSLTVQPQGVKP